MSPLTPGRGGIDRRRFIQAGAAGTAAAAVWTAPSILSLDQAFAVGTCPGGSLTFPWSTGGGCTQHTQTTNPLVGNIGGATGVDIRIINTNVSGVNSIQDNFRTRTGSGDGCGAGPCTGTPWIPRGTQNSFYSLMMSPGSGPAACTGAGTAGRWSEVTFGFFVPNTTTPQAVRNLKFSLTDVDYGSGNYLDRVYVAINQAATNYGTIAIQNNAATTGSGQDITGVTRGPGTPRVTQQIANRAVFQGTGSTAATDTNSNVALQFRNDLSIASVTVRFRDQLGRRNGAIDTGGSSQPQTIQWVGIGDLSFCKYI